MVCIVRLRPIEETRAELLVFLFIYRVVALYRPVCSVEGDDFKGLRMVPLESAAGQGRDPMQSWPHPLVTRV